MPYNYLLTSNIRQQIGLNLKDSIIIIDEAHNISQSAEDVSEFEMKESDLKKIIERELLYLLNKRDT